MKATTINGKRYDSSKCESLASRDHRTVGTNNYSGETRLLLASDGALLLHTDSNGQDCWLTDSLSLVNRREAQDWLEGIDLTDDQEAILEKMGMIEIIN